MPRASCESLRAAAVQIATVALLSACGGSAVPVAAPAAVPLRPERSATAAGKLVTIASNLASYPSGRYWGFEGTLVEGPDGEAHLGENWRAIAFIPAFDYVATSIKAAVEWGAGTNGVVVSLDRDDDGVPGAALASVKLQNLPKFGTCCQLEAATFAKGVALTAGTQYWIEVSTDRTESTTYATWVFNVTDQVDSSLEASYCPAKCGLSKPGWTPYQSDEVTGSALAYAVFGSK
jgi:hypothetical protein